MVSGRTFEAFQFEEQWSLPMWPTSWGIAIDPCVETCSKLFAVALVCACIWQKTDRISKSPWKCLVPTWIIQPFGPFQLWSTWLVIWKEVWKLGVSLSNCDMGTKLENRWLEKEFSQENPSSFTVLWWQLGRLQDNSKKYFPWGDISQWKYGAVPLQVSDYCMIFQFVKQN